MPRVLVRRNIVGHRIAEVLQTDWKTLDGVTVCRGFVRLDSGVFFELTRRDLDGLDEPILDVSENQLTLVHTDFSESCRNRVIDAIVASPYWPSFALVLENVDFLVCASTGIYQVGPTLLGIGDLYELKDTVDYWTLSQLQ